MTQSGAFCTQCGTEFARDSQFCTGCGNARQGSDAASSEASRTARELPSADVAAPPLANLPPPNVAPPPGAATRRNRRRLPILGAATVLLLIGAVLTAVVLRDRDPSPAAASTSSTADGLAATARAIAARQQLVSRRVREADSSSRSFRLIRIAASGLNREILLAQGRANTFTAATSSERAQAQLFKAALAKHARYAGLLEAVRPATLTTGIVASIEQAARTAADSYLLVEGAGSTIPSIPIHPQTTSRLATLVVRPTTPGKRGQAVKTIGVPSVYTGRFTSVDRLQRCLATETAVTCTSGPSGQMVSLRAGSRATYIGVTGSADRGGGSMPEGTAFSTPGGLITCDSSSRGITCSTTTSEAEFTIGDRYLIVRNSGFERRY